MTEWHTIQMVYPQAKRFRAVCTECATAGEFKGEDEALALAEAHANMTGHVARIEALR